jgi:hypothetical protein
MYDTRIWVIVKNINIGAVAEDYMKILWEVFRRWEYKFGLYTVSWKIKLRRLSFSVGMFALVLGEGFHGVSWNHN